MTAERSEAQVLALAAEQADARRARAEAMPHPEPESVTEQLRRRAADKRAKVAEQAGQLNAGGH